MAIKLILNGVETDPATLPDKGPAFWRSFSKRQHNSRKNLDFKSEAFWVKPEEAGARMAEDRHIDVGTAPSYIDTEGHLHWKGDRASVDRRREKYYRQRGYVNKV